MSHPLPSLVGVLALSATALAGCVSLDPPTSTAPLVHRAYVWQRAWTPAVQQAVHDHDLDGLGILTHEVRWHGLRPQVATVALPELPALHAPDLVRVIRVAVPPEGVDLPHALAPILEPACARGVVHLDMDLPTGRLPEYAAWLERLRPTCDLRITALPTWLEAPAFTRVARGGFVLQVHWLDPADPTGPLLHPHALPAIQRAARLGEPFQVALPAYGHRVWMHGDQVVDVHSEDVGAGPVGAVPRVVMADPHRVAGLLDALLEYHPAALTGVWWFRLPTDQDELAWSAATLTAVRTGAPLHHDVQVQRRSQPDGSTALCLHNRGTLAALPEPVPIATGLAGGRAGWRFSPARTALVPPPGAPPLQPGRTRCVGWSRPLVSRDP